jgi:hypothetical protein
VFLSTVSLVSTEANTKTQDERSHLNVITGEKHNTGPINRSRKKFHFFLNLAQAIGKRVYEGLC